MKFKRFLSLFFVVLLAVCIPCAFLAGCNGNSGDDGTDGNTSNNGSNGDKTGSGDEIFTEGMTLAQLRAATENVYNFTFEFGWQEKEYDYNYKQNTKAKVDGCDIHYLDYSNYIDGEGDSYVSEYEYFDFVQDGYNYYYEYDRYGSEEEKSIEKSLLTNAIIYENDLWWHLDATFDLTDGEAGLEVDEEETASENFQVTSSYVRLKGSVLEFGWSEEGKPGTAREGESMQSDIKVYGVNATVVDTGKIQSELADAEWADYVSYNGYRYRKAVDKDGNEYYYIESSNNSEAEPEKTINTLPVKPRES